MTELEDKRTQLVSTLEQTCTWLRSLDDLPLHLASDRSSRDSNIDEVESLIQRASSTLINIAFLGTFSSGKSFLLSGLQRHLGYTEINTPSGIVSPKYIGVLPSRTEAVTAVPVTVVPAPMETNLGPRGFSMSVRFEDSDSFEVIGDSLSPSTVYAYVANQKESDDRLPEYLGRSVAEVEISLAKSDIPAKLYDLPGYGSTNAVHDNIIQQSLSNADCLIYVTSAVRPLSSEDLASLGALYDRFTSLGRKRIIWVTTAIDLALQIEGPQDRHAYENTVARNNQLLLDSFRHPDGTSDRSFYGEGFIGVSPALEAQARWRENNQDALVARQLKAASRMDILRDRISRLIEEETGPNHISSIAADARLLIGPRARQLSSVLSTQKAPIEELEVQARGLRQRIDGLDGAATALREQFTGDLERRLRLVQRTLGGMQKHLHARLDDAARSTNHGKKEDLNRLEVLRIQVIDGWMKDSAGPVVGWERQLADFKSEIVRRLRSAAGEETDADISTDRTTITIEDLDLSSGRRRRAAQKDFVQRSVALVGGVSSIAGSAAAALGVLSGPLLLIPGGVAVGALALYAAIWRRSTSRDTQEFWADQWIGALDEDAVRIEKFILETARLQGQDIIESAMDVLNERRDDLTELAFAIESRRNESDVRSQEKIVDLLGRITSECEQIMRILSSLQKH